MKITNGYPTINPVGDPFHKGRVKNTKAMSATNRGATFKCSGFYQDDSLKLKGRLRGKRGENYYELPVKLWLDLNYTEAKKGRGLPKISKLGSHSTILWYLIYRSGHDINICANSSRYLVIHYAICMTKALSNSVWGETKARKRVGMISKQNAGSCERWISKNKGSVMSWE